jgi:hypothetical protein
MVKMKKYPRIILFLFLSFYACAVKANNNDSIPTQATGKKNLVEINFLGNNYWSPFFGFFLDTKYGLSPLSISYSRSVYCSNSHFQFSLGLSTFRSYYREHPGSGMPTIYHKPWAVCIPAGFLWRVDNKRSGLAIGLFCTSAFVRQDYFVRIDRHTEKRYTVHYDYQLMPNLCYEFRTKQEELIFKIAYTPKISSALARYKDGYDWTIWPVWFGLSIGGGW